LILDFSCEIVPDRLRYQLVFEKYKMTTIEQLHNVAKQLSSDTDPDDVLFEVNNFD
jgi:hypothetical protein